MNRNEELEIQKKRLINELYEVLYQIAFVDGIYSPYVLDYDDCDLIWSLDKHEANKNGGNLSGK